MCGRPVEIDDVAAARRLSIETAMSEDLGIPFRVPDDVHTGHCLRQHEFREARERIAASPIPVTPPEYT